MMQRNKNNPLIVPVKENSWETYAAFNGSVVKEGEKTHIFYRAIGDEVKIDEKSLRLSTIGHAQSDDGVHFTNRELFLKPEEAWEKFGCEDPRVTIIDGEYFIFYTGLSDFPPYPGAIKIAVATGKDFSSPIERHLVTPFNAKAMVLFPRKINGKYAALLTVNTDIPPAKIAIAYFDRKEDMWSGVYWRNWYQSLDEHVLPLQRLNSDQIEVGAVPIYTEHGWLFIYAHIQNYYTEKDRIFGIEAVLLDHDNPQKIIGRIEESLLIPQEKYELEGTIHNIVFPSGAVIEDDIFSLYYGGADTVCCVASMPVKELLSKMRTTNVTAIKATKFAGNPILEPLEEHTWESKGVLNPAAVYENDAVHIVYRSFSQDNTSAMGYAESKDGFHISERLISPIYVPRKAFEDKKNLGGNSGCEDPRMSKVDDRFYMTYTAYDGVHAPRVAMSSIKVSDFLQKHYLWSQPILISPPDVDDKDACVLSEKINGKYVIFHRINNNIVLDSVDTLDFNGSMWVEGKDMITPGEASWEHAKIGISAPPIKTSDGWVLLYHGISEIDHEYRVGAMLLESNNPSHVLARTPYPILEPVFSYEREGLVANVVFPCGAVVINDTLFIYYGGADKVVGVATMSFSQLCTYLHEVREPRFVLS